MSARVHDIELSSSFDQREQLLIRVARSAASLIHADEKPVHAMAASARPCAEIPLTASARVGGRSRPLPRLRVLAYAVAVLVSVGSGGSFLLQKLAPPALTDQPIDSSDIDNVVERIVAAESQGGTALSQRSSAAGPAQFLAGTWLELIQAYRPDLMKNHSAPELLSMRSDPTLARYMTRRLLEKHAGMLRRRRLPVTAWTLYLGHFAGGAGAVAVLSAPTSADAALVLARADATGKVTREKIVAANPFIGHYTIGDLHDWAKRKMGDRGSKSWLARAESASCYPSGCGQVW